MKTLAEKPNGMGGKWVLIDYGNNFFAYGCESDAHSIWGFPVNQCGTKDEVLQHCQSIAELCNENIRKYSNELSKHGSRGWELMIEQEQKELEMLTEFTTILNEYVS
jgi:hypothetical protein